MEAAEISVYSLSEILTMNEGWLPRFLERLAIPESDDALGQIVLALASLGKLTYLPPINSDNLRELIDITRPTNISRTREMIRTAGVMPSVNRLELMKQYLSYATVPLAESPRFLPVVRPASPRTPVSAGFEAIPEAQRGEFVALVNLINNFPSETIQEIVKHYSYWRIQRICKIITEVLTNKSVRLSSVLTEKLRNLNELLCNSEFFWRLKTQHDFGISYTTPLNKQTWKQNYVYLLEQINKDLIKAGRYNDVSRVKELLAHGANVNFRALTDGDTPLIEATSLGHLDIVKLLLAYRADVNFRDPDGESALIIASENGHLNIAELLLAYRADVNFRDNDGYTALMVASENGHLNVVELLLSKGADPDLQATNGDTALFLASDRARWDIVDLLNASGADR